MLCCVCVMIAAGDYTVTADMGAQPYHRSLVMCVVQMWRKSSGHWAAFDTRISSRIEAAFIGHQSANYSIGSKNYYLHFGTMKQVARQLQPASPLDPPHCTAYDGRMCAGFCVCMCPIQYGLCRSTRRHCEAVT